MKNLNAYCVTSVDGFSAHAGSGGCTEVTADIRSADRSNGAVRVNVLP
jgi:hypothetical protein